MSVLSICQVCELVSLAPHHETSCRQCRVNIASASRSAFSLHSNQLSAASSQA